MNRLIIFTFFIAVSSPTFAQTTLKRYKWLFKAEKDNELVTFNIASSKASSNSESSDSKTIFDLTDRGQEAALTKKTDKVIVDLLNKKFLEAKSASGPVIDLSTVNLKVTFSINRKADYSRKNLSAYDRVEYLNYTFSMNDTMHKEARFISWNKYTTEYGTLEIGSLNYSQTFGASLNITGKISASKSSKRTKTSGDDSAEYNTSFGPELSIDPSVNYSTTRVENQLVKQRYLQLTGTFDERRFSIYQQGTRETDLAGNVSIDLTMKLPRSEAIVSSFSDLYNSNNLPNVPANVKLGFKRYYIPDTDLLPHGVIGKLSYDFAVRHIRGKAKTFVEYDDRINFILGEKKLDSIVLIKKEELKVPIYFINIALPNKPSLTFEEGGKDLTIQFISYEEAWKFRNWLVFTMKDLQSDLIISGRKITFDGLGLNDKSVRQNINDIMIDFL